MLDTDLPAPVLIADIPFVPVLESLRAAAAGADDRSRMEELAAEAAALARPKAVFRLAFVGERGDDWVEIGGQRLHSRVLRVNLERAEKVCAYVATCGRELEDWAEALTDPLEKYWAGSLMEMALRSAVKVLNERLDGLLPGRTASMNPGSLEDWPLTEQRALFALLPGLSELAGVRLTESCLMLPVKSVSGLRFPVERNFENCQLCPRRDCPDRRAPYDPELFGRRYGRWTRGGERHEATGNRQ